MRSLAYYQPLSVITYRDKVAINYTIMKIVVCLDVIQVVKNHLIFSNLQSKLRKTE
jgi:hypothetical protein